MTRIVRSGPTMALSILCLAVFGCASGGPGGDVRSQSSVRMDMGLASSDDMLNETQDILRRQAFRIFRTDPAPTPYIESEWRNQTPLADEAALGVIEVRCRVLVRGRERVQSSLQRRSFLVTYTMEVEVKVPGTEGWIRGEVTSQRSEMAEAIGRELKLALELQRR